MDLSTDEKFEKLYSEFRKPLLRYISYKVSDTYSAEEILNDVFLKAVNSIESLKDKTKVHSWLYKIASNQIIDYYRRKKENFVDINDDISISEEENIETVYEELNCCVEEFLEQLPKQYSDSLKAVYLDEYTQKEYADMKQLKLSTVKSQIKRGKESMKGFFEKCCEFEKDRLDNMTACKSKYNDCKSC